MNRRQVEWMTTVFFLVVAITVVAIVSAANANESAKACKADLAETLKARPLVWHWNCSPDGKWRMCGPEKGKRYTCQFTGVNYICEEAK